MHQFWFHVKSGWQKNSVISTLWNSPPFNQYELVTLVWRRKLPQNDLIFPLCTIQKAFILCTKKLQKTPSKLALFLELQQFCIFKWKIFNLLNCKERRNVFGCFFWKIHGTKFKNRRKTIAYLGKNFFSKTYVLLILGISNLPTAIFLNFLTRWSLQHSTKSLS